MIVHYVELDAKIEKRKLRVFKCNKRFTVCSHLSLLTKLKPVENRFSSELCCSSFFGLVGILLSIYTFVIDISEWSFLPLLQWVEWCLEMMQIITVIP